MRWVVGLILVFAATLKAAQLFTDPVTALATDHAHWLVPLHVGLEFGIGLLILSGLYWQQLRWLALLLFTIFAAYSLHLALGGAASCGCFGPVKLHPRWTFMLDLAVVFGLLATIYLGDRRASDQASSPRYGHSYYRVVVASIAAISLIGTALLVRHIDGRTAQAGDLLMTAGELVILEPETWVGKPLPIADAIDLDLTHGDWIVLLHRHDCPDCQAAVPRYEELARWEPVALVEVPPYEDHDASTTGAAHRARLTNDREWFVQTPVELRLQDGVVLAVKSGHGD